MLKTKLDRENLRNQWIQGRTTEKYRDLEILTSPHHHIPTNTERFSLAIWRGTAGMPYINYLCRTAEQRQRYIDEAKKYADQREEYNQKRENPIITEELKKGDLFYTSWGYDQTNYDYLAIMAVSPTKKTAKCQMVHSLDMGTSGQSNVQEPIFCPFGDIFTMRIKGNYRGEVMLTGSYPYCNGDMHNKRLDSFSRVTQGQQFHETMPEFGH